MSNVETARTVVGIIGNVISFFLYISPAQTFHKIHNAKSVLEFKPYPYLATVLNCAMWMFYGLPFVTADNTLIVTINCAGLIIEISFVAMFFFYSDWEKRRKIITLLFVEFVFFTVVVVVTTTLLHTKSDRSTFVGIVCIIITIGMYASPLTVMGDVIRTKSVKFLPFCLSLASFLNGSVWMTYALLRFDANIFVPNSLGAVLGGIQLLLYATYYKTTNWDDDEDDRLNAKRPLLV